MQRWIVGIATLALWGCGFRSVRTYATPVASAPPSGKVRIVPLPPVITKTKAVYEWQVVCDQRFFSANSVNGATTFSGSSPVNRLKGELPMVVTMFIEVTTKPHGDGTMDVEVKRGHRDTKTRPLLEPSAKPSDGGYGYSGSGMSGYTEMPASSFVLPMVPSSTVVAVPSKTLLARITYPAPTLGVVTAMKYEGSKSTLGYRGVFPLDKSGNVPGKYMMTPKLMALMKQGYQVTSTTGGGKATKEDITVAFAR